MFADLYGVRVKAFTQLCVVRGGETSECFHWKLSTLRRMPIGPRVKLGPELFALQLPLEKGSGLTNFILTPPRAIICSLANVPDIDNIDGTILSCFDAVITLGDQEFSTLLSNVTRFYAGMAHVIG
jgi:hypothetical protein